MTTIDPSLDAHVNSNWGTAEHLLDLIGDFRLLTDSHVREDAAFCVLSAMKLRDSMGTLMHASTPGPLREALRDIRGAARSFVSAGGAHGINFEESEAQFRINLISLRLAVARQIEYVVGLFGMQAPREVLPLLSVIQQNQRP